MSLESARVFERDSNREIFENERPAGKVGVKECERETRREFGREREREREREGK